MSRVRSGADWLSVRDPGWGRAQMGWRTLVGLVAGMATGYFTAPAVGLPAMLGLLFGGLLGLLTGMIVAGAPAGELARHLAWYLPAFALAQLLGVWLAPHKAAGLALIVVVVFLQAYLSRFGHDGHSFGVALFAFYLVGLQAPISLQVYPRALAIAAASVAAVFLARAMLCRHRPVRDLRRTQRAFQAACRRAAASAAAVLQGRDRASRQLRRDLARVNTVALVFDGRLSGDGVSGATPDDEQGRILSHRLDRFRRRRRGGRCVQDRRQLRKRGQKRVVGAPMGDKRGAGNERGDHRLGRRHRALEAGAERQHRTRLARKRRCLVIDEGDCHRALILRRALHGDDIGALARLRDGDCDCALKLERRVVERGDRGPERSASKPKLKLDQVLEIKGRVIGTAAGDRCDKGWLARPQIRRQLSGEGRIGGQLAPHDGAGLRDLRGHERLAHRGAPSVR